MTNLKCLDSRPLPVADIWKDKLGQCHLLPVDLGSYACCVGFAEV